MRHEWKFEKPDETFQISKLSFLCDFDRASSLIYGNKMPTSSLRCVIPVFWRSFSLPTMPTNCNRGFYCRSYCLLNMFRVPLCPSSGAQEYYTVIAACGISCCGFQVAGPVWSWGLCVWFAGCCSILQTAHITLGIVVPETCWASDKICNKNLCCI